ncbi:hypothetical protein SLEP1_g24743 [Rubroshorea leprosula]|uniref:Transposase n=1 Tax=Rubroshorea leprosula TaxID=152421 RepID=A0AAV5JLX5_9ROSI|nr:hypothetical protein SLEP1_g24743 [Rubroshorea leprosula]
MQPLIEELQQLWDAGIETFDASKGERFQLRAALLWTINDSPTRAMLFGWSTRGEKACPCCGYDTESMWLYHDTESMWLYHNRKYCYMGHRRWLDRRHGYRHDKKTFDGNKELRMPPGRISGSEILSHADDVNIMEGESSQPLKKISIFFTLPYWQHNLLPHNIDMMHTEKNVFDNTYGTITDQDGKTKDNYKARCDLQDMGLRADLHPKPRSSNNSKLLPKACYQMIAKEKDAFFKVSKDIKLPDEYSCNISCCVQVKQRKIIGLKSYDCRILMEELLPVAIRGSLPKRVASIIIELCHLFKCLCTKVLKKSDVDELKSQSAIILCEMEKIFPPSFFTVMVHLIMHLAEEVKLGGPVAYRWMCPIERFLLTLKNYVSNKAHPEGSIAEAYLSNECLTFCSRYLEGVETRFNRPLRNDDEDDREHSNEVTRMEQQGYVFSEKVKWLSKGPSDVALTYSGYLCDWADTQRGCKKDEFGFTLVNFNRLSHTGNNPSDDPYIFASQASKVFYIEDAREKDWQVVKHVKVRGAFDLGEVIPIREDEVGGTDMASTWVRRDTEEEGIIVTSDMEPSQQPAPSGNNVGESNHQHAVLEETNSRAPSPPPRKPRGPTLLSHIWELDKGAKVNVMFDANCHPIGKEGCTLTRFIGTIARKSDVAPINYKDWRDMPQIYKDDMWKIIEKISKQNKENRLKLEEPHCLGTKTFARFVNEKESSAEGRKLSRAKLYIQSRTKKEGGPEQLKNYMSESTSSANALEESTYWKDDVLSKVKGSDKKGRVRCLGKVPTSKKSVPSTSANGNVEERLSEVENMLSGLMQLVKARFPDENITDILQAANQLGAANRLDREVPDANSGQGFSPNNRSSSQSSHHLLFRQNESNEENDGQRD